MTLIDLNQLSKNDLKEKLTACCGSSIWVNQMANHQPFASKQSLIMLADQYWYRYCTEEDWLAAFKHHPEIGDISSLEKKFASTKDWAGQEQAGVNVAPKDILKRLAGKNKVYKEKFGYIFIVCATGKSATEMLGLLEKRLPNNPDLEIKVAMEEQAKITKIRLEKLLTP